MEIEYIYPEPDDKNTRQRIRQIEKQNTLGCLVSLFVFSIVGFIFLTLLPFVLIALGWFILFLGGYILYKAYVEEYVFRFIRRLKSRR